MRLTLPLWKQDIRRWFKEQWKAHGQRKIIEIPVPKHLIEKNVPILDAKTIANPLEVLPKIEILEPWKPPLIALDKNHPNWKNRICHQFGTETLTLEGHKQVQILTKTIIFEGLPKRILLLPTEVESANQDELVKRSILLSSVWDGWQVRLPKVIDLARPGIILPREYGIPAKRRIMLLLRNLIRLMDCQVGAYEGVQQRTCLGEARSVVMAEKNNDLLQFNMKANILMSSNKPLQQFANSDEIKRVEYQDLPTIFPMKYTIDMTKTNIYAVEDHYPISKGAAHPYSHTLYICHVHPKPTWKESQILGKAIVMCYTFAVAQAKKIYGVTAKKLPEPISVQCVVSSHNEFSFLAYQLNTLDLEDSDGGRRNMAWVEMGIKLYDKCTEVGGQLQLEGYNPDVYRLLLALHLNGIVPGKRLPQIS